MMSDRILPQTDHLTRGGPFAAYVVGRLCGALMFYRMSDALREWIRAEIVRLGGEAELRAVDEVKS